MQVRLGGKGGHVMSVQFTLESALESFQTIARGKQYSVAQELAARAELARELRDAADAIERGES